MMLAIGSIVIRVVNLMKQVEFWSNALDYAVREMEDPEGNRFCVIDAADWSGWSGPRVPTAQGDRSGA